MSSTLDPNIISKLTGFMVPGSLVDVLGENGLKAKIGTCKSKNYGTKINVIKDHLQTGPVILLIGHGYKGIEFSILRAFVFQHYISIWGYNDDKQHFYVYDSSADKNIVKHQQPPVGNIFLPYNDLISCRNYGGLGLVSHKFIYIRDTTISS